MKKLIKIFFVIYLIVSYPNTCNAFELEDIINYQGIAIKSLAQTDSLHKSNKSTKTEIAGFNTLEKLLGKDKVYYKTQYIYMGDKKLEVDGETTWYYSSPKSWKKRRKYALYYRKNQVMEQGYDGDTLVIAKKSSDEIVLLIIQNGSDAQKKLFEILSIKNPSTKDVSLKDELINENLPITNNKWIEIYFTPSLDCENNIISSINKAKKIDIAVYSITNRNIVDAIKQAQIRGAEIRIITDRLQSKGKSSLVSELTEAGLPLKTNIKHKIMHHKFAIFNGKEIETGSYNWTSSASKSNAENCQFFIQPRKEYSEQFERLWNFYDK